MMRIRGFDTFCTAGPDEKNAGWLASFASALTAALPKNPVPPATEVIIFNLYSVVNNNEAQITIPYFSSPSR